MSDRGFAITENIGKGLAKGYRGVHNLYNIPLSQRRFGAAPDIVLCKCLAHFGSGPIEVWHILARHIFAVVLLRFGTFWLWSCQHLAHLGSCPVESDLALLLIGAEMCQPRCCKRANSRYGFIGWLSTDRHALYHQPPLAKQGGSTERQAVVMPCKQVSLHLLEQ